MLKFVHVKDDDANIDRRIIVDVENKTACLYSIIFCFTTGSDYWRFEHRFVSHIGADKIPSNSMSTEHRLLLSKIVSKSFMSGLSGIGLTGRLVTIEDIEAYTTLPRVKPRTRRRVRAVVDAMSKAFEAPARENFDNLRRQYDAKSKLIREQVVPAIVKNKLIPGITTAYVVDNEQIGDPTRFDNPTLGFLVDAFARINVVARVDRSFLTGVGVKYSDRYSDKLSVALGIDKPLDGDSLAEPDYRYMLPDYIASVCGEDYVVSSIMVVERYYVGDLITDMLNNFARIYNGDLSTIKLKTGVVVDGMYLYRVSPKKVLLSIPWSLIREIAPSSAFRVWKNRRAAS